MNQRVRMISNPSSYETYQMTKFGGETDPNKVGPEADFDEDGRSNFFEYATMGDPEKADSFTFEKLRGGVLKFKIRTDDPTLTFSIEYSETLLDFTSTKIYEDDDGFHAEMPDVPFILSKDDSNSGPDYACVKLLPINSRERIFVRLKVTQNK